MIDADGMLRQTTIYERRAQFLRLRKELRQIPDDLAEPISWIVACGNFSPAELAAEYPQLSSDVREKLISSLTAMKAIAPA